MNLQTKKLLNEIANSSKELAEIKEKIEIVQDEGLNLIRQANKTKNTKLSYKLFHEGDSIMEKLGRAICN